MWSPIEKCWVPTCFNNRDEGYKKNFFPLPSSLKYKEIWLALAGRRLSGSQGDIYFCQDHFNPMAVETYMEKFVCLNATAIPYYNMPERICRTCMTVIVRSEVFCVLSANVPCSIPPDIKSDVLTCRPEPLLQILNFCIPELNLYQDPPPLVCYKCSYNIWLFYIFKLTCNAIEKGVRGHLPVADYGKLVLCRSCPMTSGTSFFILKEDSSMGNLLKKMFLNNYPTDVVPLKLCLKCWNSIYKLERFYSQCLSVEEKFQRHAASTQMTLDGTMQLPVGGAPVPEPYKKAMNQRREFRQASTPYQKTAQHDGGGTSTDNIIPLVSKSPEIATISSVIKFGAKQEHTASYAPSEIQTLTLKSESQIVTKNEMNTVPGGEFGDDSDEKQDAKYLTAVEKAALAGLMLKYGEPLKTNTSPKVHFEAWVKVVREFHQLGYESSFEAIQRTWAQMKKDAKLAFQSIAPATYIDQLVIEYLQIYRSDKGFQINAVSGKTVNKIENCEVICIDDDNDEAHKNTEKVENVIPTTSKTSKPAKITADRHDKEDSDKRVLRPKRKAERGTATKDIWHHDQNLTFIRSMRKEYDKCLNNNELASGKSPWKRIIERLIKKEYSNYSFNKLYNVWGKLRTSATIHEKNGLDIVDDEVWDMLQVQNAVQKSIGKNGNSSKNVESVADVKENISQSSSKESEDKRNDISGQLQSPKDCKSKHDSSGDGSKVAKPNPPKVTNEKSRPLQLPKSTKRPRHVWTMNEKTELFKLIKKEFLSMLKKGELIPFPWRKIAVRIYEDGYKNKKFSSSILYTTWRTMRCNATLHENTGERTILDDKIIRLLKLHNKLRSTNSLQKRTPANDSVVSKAAKTTETIEKKIEDSKKEVEENTSTKDLKKVNWVRHQTWTAQKKLDLISVIRSYGKEVFQTKLTSRNLFWPKVTSNFNAKGYKTGSIRIRSYWTNMLNSAKLAWAGQKEPSTYDQIIIDFLTEVIKNKNEDGNDAKENETGNGDEQDANENQQEEDDEFDEISERMSDATNSPTNAASEENDCVEMNYDYVSLEDIENNFNIVKTEKDEADAVKPDDEPLPFKIESYTSEQVIEISDSEED